MGNFKASIYTVSFLVIAILILFALHVFPIPGTDSLVFIPPALYCAKGQGLANPLYYVTIYTDLTHTNRFNYYVPFFPWLLGLLARIQPSIKTIFFFCALFSGINILLYARQIVPLGSTARSKVLRWAILLSVPFMAQYMLPTVGRPENLTSLLALLLFLMYRNRSKFSAWSYYTLAAALLGIMLATQIICFYFCFLVFLLYETISAKKVLNTILFNLVLFFASIAICAAILALSPNGLTNTIEGIRIHITGVVSRDDRSFSLFIHYWLLAVLEPGFLLIFLMSSFFFGREIYTKTAHADTLKKVVVLAILLLVAVGLVKFILYASPTVYNASEFVAIMAIYCFRNISGEGLPRLRAFTIYSLITFTFGTLYFLRTLVLFIDNQNTGKTYDKARETVNSMTGNNKTIVITSGLWSLFDDLGKPTLFYPNQYKSGDTVIVQQAYQAATPEMPADYTILYDWRVKETERRFMGIKLANTPQGYSFVICKVK